MYPFDESDTPPPLGLYDLARAVQALHGFAHVGTQPTSQPRHFEGCEGDLGPDVRTVQMDGLARGDPGYEG
jgi:hypothetical protein